MLDSQTEAYQKAEGEIRLAEGGGEPKLSKKIAVADMDGQQQVVQQQQTSTTQQPQTVSQQQQSSSSSTSQQQQQQPQTQLIVNTAGLHHQIQMQQTGGGTGNTAQESSGQTQQTANSGGQQVVGSSQGQQQQVSMDVQQQQPTVASTPQQVQQQTLLVNTANIQQQMQQVGISTPQSPMCSANSTISTMQAQGSITQPVPANAAQQLQQVSDWNTGRVQVLQQPVQNAYVQQLYNAQGQMLMSSNIALHPGPPNINPAGSIQVITAGKPFQSNQINAHVLGKPVLAGTQQTSFPSYATIPTTTNQTLVIGSLISSQPNILPAHSSNTQQQKQDIQKAQQVKSGQTSTNSVQSSLALSGCVVSQSPTMLHHLISPIQYTTCQNRSINNNGQVQLSPWQFNTQQIPQLWTTPHHPQVINAQTPIFIRGPHQDQPMFIQSPPPQPAIQQQQQTQSVGITNKPELKGPNTPQVSRTLSILPSMSTAIRPASSAVSTAQIQKQPNKLRSKIMTKNIPIQKLDAQNQTKPQPISPQQHAQTQNTKMIITSQGALMPQQLQTVGQASQATVQQIQAAQANLQAAQQQLQQQVIQPKPPPLMGIAMSTPGAQVHSPPKDVPQIQGSDEQQTLMETQPSMITQDTPQIVTVSLAPTQDPGGLMKLDSPMLCSAPSQQAEVAPPPQTGPVCSAVQANTVTVSATTTGAQQQQQQPSCTPVQPTASVQPQSLMPPTQPSSAVVLSASGSNNTPNTVQTVGGGTLTTQQQRPPSAPSQVGAAATQEIRITVLGPVDDQPPQQQPPPPVLQSTLPQTQQQPQQLPSAPPPAPPPPLSSQPPTPFEEETKSTGPPKAMVKPQVLTHVIEGYVIHESSEPFPINRSSLLTEMAKTVKSKNSIKDNNTTLDADEPPLKKANVETTPSAAAAAAGRGPTGAAIKRTKCESCAGDDNNKKKRFCNVSCLNRANGVPGKKKGMLEDSKHTEKTPEIPLTPYIKKGMEMNTESNINTAGSDNTHSEQNENNMSGNAAEQTELENLPKTNPVKWTVSDVCDFIRNLPGCCDYVEDFAIQEIDGQALLLLKEDHLMSAMSMKLGPALKICARIDTLRSIAEGGSSGSNAPVTQQTTPTGAVTTAPTQAVQVLSSVQQSSPCGGAGATNVNTGVSDK